ncbi:MAG: amino acid transporter [Euryarchaeota archaeon]|nr:amino acid transporter [Euryarchaeota archaeon]|tara:strand:+ start:552 stop:2225 length:1674 start_codon:yes stop_codon:yes gene_type:complete
MPASTARGVIDFVYRRIDEVSETLERKLGMASVVIISLSAMLGSGLFVLPALAMLDMGGGVTPVSGIWLAYLVAAVIVLPGAISKSELATAMPSSGGSYVYIERTFGSLIGTISGLGLWANFMLKSAFALIGFKAYLWVLESLLNITINIEFAALILLLLIVIINILGLKRIKKVQTPIVLTSVLFLFMLCIWAIITMDLDWSMPFSKDAFGSGWESVAHTSAFVFVAYAGVTKIAAVGGEIKDPGRNIPYGILLSLLISCLLYVSISIVMVAAIEPTGYMNNGEAREDPIYVFANAVGGETIGIIAAVLAVTTMTSMALAGIMASSRFPFAMARDNLLPEALENVHPKYETPHLAIIGTGIAMAAAITLLPVGDIAKLASGFKIMIFIVINCCVIVLRRASKTHSWYNPEWKSPLYPIFQIIGIFGGIVLIYLMGEKAFIGAAVCCLFGLITYYSYGKSRAHPVLTPWRTVRTEFTNSEQYEREKSWLVFHASCSKAQPGHLTLHEFIHAMEVLSPEMEHFHLRNLFHEIDDNDDGIIDVEEFLKSFDEGLLNAEE